jgi:hypothetical protein
MLVGEMARNRLVRWFQVEMTKRLDEIDLRLDRIDARLDQLSARLEPTQLIGHARWRGRRDRGCLSGYLLPAR